MPTIVRTSFDLAGRKVSYLTLTGLTTSETLLLIHGAGVSARTWVNQLRGLADVVRPVAVDLPGHRDSDPVPAPSLETYAESAYELLRHLGAGPAFVAGHSLGGAVAQTLAVRHPEQVKGLVLISTCARLPPDDGALRLLGFVPASLRRALLLQGVRRLLLGPLASADAVSLTFEEIRSCPSDTIQHDTAIGRGMDLAAIAHALRVPTLILCGGGDRLTTPALSHALGAMIAGCRLAIVPSAGHMLPLEAPDIVNALIREFVTELASPPPSARRLTWWRRLLAGVVRRGPRTS
jgi:pimeloyl-ACP methyl ester carboxylesterase